MSFVGYSQCEPQTGDDDCSNATLIQTAGTYCGSTGNYTADSPNWLHKKGSNIFGNYTIENSSYFKFVANNTSVNMTICCGTGCRDKNSSWGSSGIQALIFSGNCGSTSSPYTEKMYLPQLSGSDCSSCGTSYAYDRSGSGKSQLTSGKTCLTFNVPNLVVGTTYYLMIDGWEGDECDFTVEFNSGIVALSVELLSFTGTPTDLGNELNWVTNTEKNNDYFEVEATLDGVNFETVGRVKGAGNSTKKLTYSMLDRQPLGATTYYRLKQVDFDGTVTHHDLITVTRTMKNQINLFPNPVNDELTVDFNAEMDGTYILSFVGVSGNVVEHPVTLNKGYNRLLLPTSELAKGFYLLKVADENGNTLSTNKVVKE